MFVMKEWGKEQGPQFVARQNRAPIRHVATQYGASREGNSLHIYLPNEWGSVRTLVMAGIHGEEAEGTNVLSYALRSIEPVSLR